MLPHGEGGPANSLNFKSVDGASSYKDGHENEGDPGRFQKRSASLMQYNRNLSSQKEHDAVSPDDEMVREQLRAFQSQLLARDSQRHDRIRARNLANSRTPNDYTRHLSKLQA